MKTVDLLVTVAVVGLGLLLMWAGSIMTCYPGGPYDAPWYLSVVALAAVVLLMFAALAAGGFCRVMQDDRQIAKQNHAEVSEIADDALGRAKRAEEALLDAELTLEARECHLRAIVEAWRQENGRLSALLESIPLSE